MLISNGYPDPYLHLTTFNQIYHWQVIFYLVIVIDFKMKTFSPELKR